LNQLVPVLEVVQLLLAGVAVALLPSILFHMPLADLFVKHFHFH
jgi:hypothetical protein